VAGKGTVVERYAQKAIARVARAPMLGAWRAVAVTTILVTIAGGLLMRLTDPDTFPNIWKGLWWATQTVTTVGYGDALPESVPGRIVAVVVMLGGIGFLTVTTAAITSVFVTAARHRTGEEPGLAALERRIEELTEEVRGLRRDARGEGTGSPPGREE
jgi:voltage-gated potassium channel